MKPEPLPQAIRKAVQDSVPKGTIDLNLKAFDRVPHAGIKAADAIPERVS